MRDGEIRPDVDVDLLVEMLYSPVYLRLLFGYRELSEDYAEQALDVAFAGMAAPVSA